MVVWFDGGRLRAAKTPTKLRTRLTSALMPPNGYPYKPTAAPTLWGGRRKEGQADMPPHGVPFVITTGACAGVCCRRAGARVGILPPSHT